MVGGGRFRASFVLMQDKEEEGLRRGAAAAKVLALVRSRCVGLKHTHGCMHTWARGGVLLPPLLKCKFRIPPSSGHFFDPPLSREIFYPLPALVPGNFPPFSR